MEAELNMENISACAQNSCGLDKYKDIVQLYDKDRLTGRVRKVFPITYTQAVYDGKTGASLESILAQYNNVFLQFMGTAEATRALLPKEMRRKGIQISYRNMEDEVIVEKCVNDSRTDDTHWGLSANWARIDELSLSGEISVSAKGTWIINGEDTGIKAVGPKGDNGLTPWLKTIDNKLYHSYDNKTWEPSSDYIAAWFRFTGTSGSSQADNIGKMQISRDEGKTWTDLSGTFTNNLRISGYRTSVDLIPEGQPQGAIWAIGPTYASDDTAHTNPIYRLHVKDESGWVDNGQFTSIAAGVVQELGDSETEVISQKAITKSFNDLVSNNLIFRNYNNKVNIRIYDIKGVFPNTDSFEIGISNIGLQDGTVYIQFTKNGETGTDNLLCTVDVPVSSINDGVHWISTNKMYNSSDCHVSILIDCTQLKTTPITYINAIIDKEYLVKRVPTQKNLTSGYKYSSLLDFIIDLKLYVPSSLVSHNISAYNVGYNSTAKRVSVRFYDYTDAKVIGSVFISEDEIPTGIYAINRVTSEGYIVSCTLDFSKYMEYYVIDNITDTKVIPLDLNSSEAITSITSYVNYADVELGDVISRNSTITGEFKLTKNIILSNGQCIRGKHCVVLANDPTVNITLQYNSYIEGVTFISTKDKRVLNTTPGYYTYQNIITDEILNNIVSYIGDNQLINIRGRNSAVINCNFINIDRTAVCSLNTEDRILPENTIVSGCYFENCKCGIYNWGEFNRFIGNVFHGCEIGMYMRGGNYTLGSCIFKMSDIGMYITDSGNGSHSQVTGTEYAHCGIASLYVNKLPRALGLVFSGCHISDAPIIGINCNSLLFSGGRLDTWVDISDGVSNGFIGNIIRNSYAVRDKKALFKGDISLKNNIAMVDGIESDINN